MQAKYDTATLCAPANGDGDEGAKRGRGRGREAPKPLLSLTGLALPRDFLFAVSPKDGSVALPALSASQVIQPRKACGRWVRNREWHNCCRSVLPNILVLSPLHSAPRRSPYTLPTASS